MHFICYDIYVAVLLCVIIRTRGAFDYNIKYTTVDYYYCCRDLSPLDDAISAACGCCISYETAAHSLCVGGGGDMFLGGMFLCRANCVETHDRMVNEFTTRGLAC